MNVYPEEAVFEGMTRDRMWRNKCKIRGYKSEYTGKHLSPGEYYIKLTDNYLPSPETHTLMETQAVILTLKSAGFL